jgi:hypothetical protein
MQGNVKTVTSESRAKTFVFAPKRSWQKDDETLRMAGEEAARLSLIPPVKALMLQHTDVN